MLGAGTIRNYSCSSRVKRKSSLQCVADIHSICVRWWCIVCDFPLHLFRMCVLFIIFFLCPKNKNHVWFCRFILILIVNAILTTQLLAKKKINQPFRINATERITRDARTISQPNSCKRITRTRSKRITRRSSQPNEKEHVRKEAQKQVRKESQEQEHLRKESQERVTQREESQEQLRNQIVARAAWTQKRRIST